MKMEEVVHEENIGDIMGINRRRGQGLTVKIITKFIKADVPLSKCLVMLNNIKNICHQVKNHLSTISTLRRLF
jgi:hypothetical protein